MLNHFGDLMADARLYCFLACAVQQPALARAMEAQVVRRLKSWDSAGD